MPEDVGSDRPMVRFVGVTYAGWEMRQRRLRQNVALDGRLAAEFDAVTGWVEGGLIESLPVPTRHRGLARAAWQARRLASPRRPDALWTSALRLLGPYRSGPLRLPSWPPLVAELDWTVEQQESMAHWYYDREPRTGRSLRKAMATERRMLDHVSLFVPWTDWAADGLRRQGVAEDRIRVIHPGLRLEEWRYRWRDPPVGRAIRLLFVGGDFERKGGDLLLEAMHRYPPGTFELDVVTRDQVGSAPGVLVHRCSPDSPELHALYESADVFVLPTRAECFGYAIVEAMAYGLPVLAGDVGGVGEIVTDGEDGWLVPPTPAGVVDGLELVMKAVGHLGDLGRAGRRTVEARFDGPRNDELLVDSIVELIEARRGNTGRA